MLSLIHIWIMATITQRVSREMRSDISHKITRLPMWYYNRTTTGDVLSRVTNDVDTIGQSLNQSIGGLVSAVVLLLGSLVMMLLTNVWMTLTAVVASLLGFALMFAIMGKSQKYFRRQQKHLGQLNGHIEEIYTGHTVVKACLLYTSCWAAVGVTGLCLPYLTRGSRVLEICSTAAFQPMPGLGVYAATKAFLHSYAKTLHHELLPKGIHVTAVCPYWVKDTEFIPLAQEGKAGQFHHFPLASRSKSVVVSYTHLDVYKRQGLHRLAHLFILPGAVELGDHHPNASGQAQKQADEGVDCLLYTSGLLVVGVGFYVASAHGSSPTFSASCRRISSSWAISLSRWRNRSSPKADTTRWWYFRRVCRWVWTEVRAVSVRRI